MDNLKHLSTEQLVDILSTQTSLFIQMHTTGASETEFEKCKLLIQSVQAEIKARSQSKDFATNTR